MWNEQQSQKIQGSFNENNWKCWKTELYKVISSGDSNQKVKEWKKYIFNMTHGPSQRKQNKNIDDNNVRHIPVPPDGGYGWIIVSLNSYNNLISQNEASL